MPDAIIRRLVIIPAERRRENNGQVEEEKRLSGKEDDGTFVMSAQRFLATVAVLVTLITGGMTFVYTKMLDAEMTQFRLESRTIFIPRIDTLDRREYELRHQELVDDMKRMGDRLKAIEDRTDSHARRLDDIQSFKGRK